MEGEEEQCGVGVVSLVGVDMLVGFLGKGVVSHT